MLTPQRETRGALRKDSPTASHLKDSMCLDRPAKIRKSVYGAFTAKETFPADSACGWVFSRPSNHLLAASLVFPGFTPQTEQISNAKNFHPYNVLTQKTKPQNGSALFYNTLKFRKFPSDATTYHFLSSHFLILIIQSAVLHCDFTKNHRLLFHFSFLCQLDARCEP